MKKNILFITLLFLTNVLVAQPRTQKAPSRPATISDEQLIALIDKKKDAIKLEEVIKLYKDFVNQNIKPTYISQFIRDWTADKEKHKKAYPITRFMEKKPSKEAIELFNKGLKDQAFKEVGLSQEQLEQEFEARWDPKRDAEYSFISHFGFGDPNVLKKIKEAVPEVSIEEMAPFDKPNFPELFKKKMKKREEEKKQKIAVSPAAFLIKMIVPLTEKYKEPFKQHLVKELKLK